MTGADGIDIRSGGIVAVDTAELREAALELAALAGELDALQREVESVTIELAWHPETAWSPVEIGGSVVRALADTVHAAGRLAAGLREMADVYEILELEAARAAGTAGGDVRALFVLERRLAEARERMPEAAARADVLAAAWPFRRHLELELQIAQAGAGFGLIGFVAPLVSGSVLGLAGVLGLGRVERAERSAGPVPSVDLERVAAPPASAPVDLADLAARIPQDRDEQIRVERYVDPGGAQRFAVYVAGTRAPLGFGGDEPMDMASNIDLYTGQRAASVEAVAAALREAGAKPGDTVLAVGHSQGGAAVARLALESEFAVAAVVTLGSPVHVDPPADTIDITLRHTDDPVPALQSGGHPAGTGAPGSFVAERVADPGGSPGDVGLGAHGVDAYRATAAFVDGSGDPRVAQIHGLLASFGGASRATTTLFHARRSG
ncbi:alpha/beta fold hydrolase [Microbacterium radiodurans]|uniref:Alpha/beta hydrolase n=1 Tax=Microbacterium radiodurans TaxID=661398 RepID=A0A5J5ITI1_9MICO|nr:hypothetical protein [Microbacterium radiodurans]KAA9089198.1 hypothetical protein F6B42_01490 [Microbacterium radiodurans]